MDRGEPARIAAQAAGAVAGLSRERPDQACADVAPCRGVVPITADAPTALPASISRRSNPMNQTLSPERVRADVAELLDCDPAGIAPEENLVDLGLDSVRIMVLVDRWRAAGAAALEFADLAEQPELGHWTELLTGGAA